MFNKLSHLWIITNYVLTKLPFRSQTGVDITDTVDAFMYNLTNEVILQTILLLKWIYFVYCVYKAGYLFLLENRAKT